MAIRDQILGNPEEGATGGPSGSFYEQLLAGGLEGFGKRRRFKRGTNRLFGQLGFAPKDRRSFRQAVAGGGLNEFFQNRPTSAKLFQDFVNFDPAELTGGKRAVRRDTRALQLAKHFGTQGGFDFSAIPSPTEDPDFTNEGPEGVNPPGSGPIQPRQPRTGGTLEDLIGNFGAQLGPAGQALVQGGTGPSFDEMYQQLLALNQEQGDKNAARLREAFGSRGNRYGSELLNAESNLRRGQGLDLGLAANQLRRDLRQDRTRELMAGAELEQNARQAAIDRLFKDFLIQSAPPPLFAPGAQYTGGFSPGDNISFFR